MTAPSRRQILAGAAVLGGAATALRAPGAAWAAPATTDTPGAFEPTTVGRDDIRYGDLVRGSNQRWVGRPDYIRLVSSTDQVVQAVQEAVSAGKRMAVRSGGHCYENFVADPDVQVVIDLSEMSAVGFDRTRNAFVIEAGASLATIYDRLYKIWGVTIPGGSCPTVGAGGHIAGGGYGPLSRLHGLTVDYLHALEVVVVDASGRARAVVATRDANDPNHDLWWAHTGGGGGNFGIVTRYWLRGTEGTKPDELLPRPPATVLVSAASWPWSALTEKAFTRLLVNHSAWHEGNSNPGSRAAGLFSHLIPRHVSAGSVGWAVQVDATRADADRLLDDHFAAVNSGVGVTPNVTERRTLPWLHALQWPGLFGGNGTLRFKAKSAYMRSRFPDEQAAAYHHHLTRSDYANPTASVMIASYGGAVNAVKPADTATVQRDSILKLQYTAPWTDPVQDDEHLAWIREFYRDVYASTGGVPARNSVNDGAFINYVDVDLADPQWNTSGVPWSTLYYGQNYPRLQQVKARWDPRDVFHHDMSIRPATPSAAGRR